MRPRLGRVSYHTPLPMSASQITRDAAPRDRRTLSATVDDFIAAFRQRCGEIAVLIDRRRMTRDRRGVEQHSVRLAEINRRNANFYGGQQ